MNTIKVAGLFAAIVVMSLVTIGLLTGMFLFYSFLLTTFAAWMGWSRWDRK